MQGLGPVEFTLIALVALMLFGPTLLAFWLGFVLGKKRGATPQQPSGSAVEPLPVSEPDAPATAATDQPAQPDAAPTQPTEESTTDD